LPVNQQDVVAQIALFITVACTVLMGVSRRMGELLLGLVSTLLRAAFVDPKKPELTLRQQSILAQIPRTLDTALKKFHLESQTTTYAVCPTCHAIYPPVLDTDSDNPQYPQICSNLPFPDSEICGTKLLDSDDRSKPVKTFVYHSFHDFLAGLLARPDLEQAMDNVCDARMDSIRSGDVSPPYVADIFDGEYISTFEGPEPGRLFIDRPGTEGRYLFALNFDFFTTERKTIRGADSSCGIISTACVNLPLNIRYKPENMYVAGMIPDHPSTTELNHYVRPIVDDMSVSWEQGVNYSRTANHPEGRDTRSAIVCGVCDLPGGRQFSATANFNSHNYCSRCHCHHLDTIGRTDTDSPAWKPKDPADQRQKAEAWRDASSKAEQERLFTDHGFRWSPLWRLPYWDPARMLVVDTMHCLFEGLAQFHFREVLKLTKTEAETAEVVSAAFEFNFSVPTENDIKSQQLEKSDVKDIRKIHEGLVAVVEGASEAELSANIQKLTKRLEGKHLKALQFVSKSLQLQVKPVGNRVRKRQHAEALVTWVSSLFSLHPAFQAQAPLSARGIHFHQWSRLLSSSGPSKSWITFKK
jgi:hypothetical protein